jgi:hypothetical protein
MFSASSFSEMPVRPASVEGSADDGGGRFYFDPARICAGIEFHLLDEELVVSVEADSVVRTLRRLTEEDIRASVARAAWHGMSGRERLEWLLRNGRTRALIDRDGNATLAPPPKSLW